MPVLVIAFLFSDIPFFFQMDKIREPANGDFKWLIIERVLLHPPLIICGLLFYILGPKSLVPNLDVFSIVLSYILCYGVFFVFDKRAFQKKGTGLPIFVTGSASVILHSLFLMF